MDSNLSFEIKAEAFRIMTGHMAPGKSASPESYPAPYEERIRIWGDWLVNNEEVINAMLLSMERMLPDEQV